MILGFSTIFSKGKGKLAGRQTRFVEKIWESIFWNPSLGTVEEFKEHLIKCKQMNEYKWKNETPKIHTIRQDKANRWKKGNKIHFNINVRAKDMLQFAPVVEVVSTQQIIITYDDVVCEQNCIEPTIKIDGKCLSLDSMEQLAINDGFDNLQDFLEWFSEDFTGKLIHWTDKKY